MSMLTKMRESNSNLIADRLLSVLPERAGALIKVRLLEILDKSENDARAAGEWVKSKVAEWGEMDPTTYNVEAYERFLRISGLDGDDEQDYDDDLVELDMSLDHISDRAFADATAALESWRTTKAGKQTLAVAPRTIIESNQKLIDGTSPQAVREFLSPGDARIEAVATEAGKPKLWKAKVAHADRINKNRRIYPRAVWDANLTRLKELLPNGALGGAIDHASYSAGNLKDTCLIWRDLWMEADGAVYGKFEIIQNHPLGQAFKAQIEAGLSVGFSTSGSGSAHEPSDEERTRYGLGEDTYAAVMNGDFTLTKIDSVDDPSVADARLA